MRILYDHQMFLLQKYGGISKYYCELIKNLPQGIEYQLSVLLSNNSYLHEDAEIFKKRNIFIPNRQFKGKRFIKRSLNSINQFYSNLNLSANNFDLFHPTFYNPYFLSRLTKPYVITVHDLIAFNDTSYAHDPIRTEMEKVIQNATRIISISKNTKKDLVEILNIDPEKIDVVYHGYNQSIITGKRNIYGQYILFVGRREGYKNFKTFAKAISRLLIKERSLQLICVGEPFDREDILLLKGLKIFRQTMALNVSEAGLSNLYSNALVFVYPSLYEGFGMPILEAFANDCPLCLSNSSSFPEIAADAACYFDPHDKESIVTAIETVIYDQQFSNNLIEAGRKRLQNFSWIKTAKETVNCYEKALGIKSVNLKRKAENG